MSQSVSKKNAAKLSNNRLYKKGIRDTATIVTGRVPSPRRHKAKKRGRKRTRG